MAYFKKGQEKEGVVDTDSIEWNMECMKNVIETMDEDWKSLKQNFRDLKRALKGSKKKGGVTIIDKTKEKNKKEVKRK